MGFLKGSQMLLQNCEQNKLYIFKIRRLIISRISWCRKHFITSAKFALLYMYRQNFSHYEFLVQLVFAPRFKQRHIPRYNYIKRQQQQKKPTWNQQEQWSVNAAHVLYQKIAKSFLFPTADRRFDTKVKCPTGWPLVWVKFPTVRSLTWVKCPGVARGGDGRSWNWLVHKLMTVVSAIFCGLEYLSCLQLSISSTCAFPLFV